MDHIDVDGVHKSYGTRKVLDDVSLRVDRGEILGVLGPNGSGKTTLVECIGGLREPDAGRIVVDSVEPWTAPRGWREHIGMQLQQARLQPKITPRESLRLFARFYRDPEQPEDLLERFGLTERADIAFEKLSGGQQQRLSVALALVGRPEVAILDELTTGLDPSARRSIWDHLIGLQEDGMTVLLVTHSMEEAQYLCDRVIVLDRTRVVAAGTPEELIEEATAAGVASRRRRDSDMPVTLEEAYLALTGARSEQVQESAR